MGPARYSDKNCGIPRLMEPLEEDWLHREALALARLRGMRPLLALCHLGLGKLYRRIGETDRARENLTTAMTMYREMEMDFWLEQGGGDMTKSSDVEPRVRSASKNPPS